MNSLNAVSPIDGRYRSKCEPLARYFSEGALIKYRVRVEVEYFIALGEQLVKSGKWTAENGKRVADNAEALRDIYRHFTADDALRIKEIEKTTNHDVKAVEYFLKERFDGLHLADLKEFIHFGLTSQDINNTSVPLSMKECAVEVLLPAYKKVLALLDERAEEWKDIPMLAHTHGQPASPTTLGKEWGVFAYRLRRQIEELERLPFTAKFGGATGNFNAHLAAYPDIDWRAFGNDFVANHLGLERQQLTT
ncbi:MAG: adenylosuccinate lyase, partial [Bacteroidales bacterium]|nr:adenylosuccinate lyase [Bacteroidales bacterium]